MPKRRIIDLPGQSHFVTFSTYQRRRFLDSDETRDIVLEVLQKCLVSHQANCSGYVVMPNHVHAVLFGEEDFGISSFMQAWKRPPPAGSNSSLPVNCPGMSDSARRIAPFGRHVSMIIMWNRIKSLMRNLSTCTTIRLWCRVANKVSISVRSKCQWEK